MKEKNVQLVHVTPTAEALIAHCARVSSSNQENPDLKLLSYCIKHGHWSVFEMASMCLEIKTSRGISAQILRHRSFSFQEFSQRYAKASDCLFYTARRQDDKNRQNSIDDMTIADQAWFEDAQCKNWIRSKDLYNEAIERGIAKECARFLLPMATGTKLYMHGTVRSWVHYLQLRTTEGTQKEHRDLALEAQEIFSDVFPVTAKALGWRE